MQKSGHVPWSKKIESIPLGSVSSASVATTRRQYRYAQGVGITGHTHPLKGTWDQGYPLDCTWDQGYPPPVNRQTPVKTLPSHNYCCGR